MNTHSIERALRAALLAFSLAVAPLLGVDEAFSQTLPPSERFSDLDPYLGDALNWEPLNPARWSVATDGRDLRYGINTTSYLELASGRLGEYSLVRGRTYGDFAFSARVRSSEDLAANANADHAVVFGLQDADNYYYAMFNRTAANTQLFKVVNAVRQPALATANFAIPDNDDHLIEVARSGSAITVSVDGTPVMQADDATFGAGRIGIGSFNDAASWDDVSITGPATSTFSTLDPYAGDAANWEPLTPSRWSVAMDGDDLRYGINTTSYLELPSSRLGEYSLLKGRVYGDFAFSARVRSTEELGANANADHAVVFGLQNAGNYYYAMFNRTAANTQLFKVVGGVRQPALATGNFAIPDNDYHRVEVARSGSVITVSVDGAPIMQADDATFGTGRIGIGAFNDAAWWDDVAITGPAGPAPSERFSELDPYLGNAANWEPLTPARWSVAMDGGDLRYGINTTGYVELPSSRLGEYSLVRGRTYGDFAFSARVRSSEDLAANANADHAVVFGLQDAANYYYAMFNRAAGNTQLFKVVNGVRQPALATGSFAIPDNDYHLVEIARTGSSITVAADGVVVMQASDATFGAGRLGIGAFNDAALWDDIQVALPAADTAPPTVPENLSATAVSFSEVAVSWSAASDNVAVAGYRVYRNGTLVASPTGTAASITGLAAGTLYSFTVSAFDAAGNASAQSSPVEVTTPVPVPVPPTVSLSAAPASIPAGQSSTLTWSSTDATSCTASGDWTGILGTSGTRVVTPSSTASYILTCVGVGGSASMSTTVTVTASQPTVSLSAAPATVTAGQPSTLTWSSTNATSCTASGGWSGAKATSGSQAVTPPSTTSYVLSCTGTGGTASQSATVTVAGSGAITPSLVPSRVSGVAPLAVFFDATGTTANSTSRPFHELEYRWNFGDAASGSWSATPGMPNLSRNLATGPVAAHVFESPGTYTVNLTVLDGSGAATTSVQVTVTNPDTVFAANTLCVGAGSTPVAGVGGCPDGAAVLQSGDFDAVINGNIANRKRILFRRGDAFNSSADADIDVNGPGLIGAFGSGNRPLVNVTGNNSAIQLSTSSTPTIKDWRVMDLEINGNSGSATNGIYAEGGIDQVTLLRLNIHHVHVGVRLSPFVLDAFGGQHRLWDQFAMVDSTIQTLIGGSGGNGMYIGAQRLMLMGNVLADSTGAEHILRTPNVYKGVISHNDMRTPASAKHTVKLQAAVFGVSPTTFTEQIVMSDNKFTAGSGAAWTVTLGPQDAVENEKVRNVIVERNWFAPHASQQVALMVWAQDVTVRNNVFNLTGTSDRRAIMVDRRGVEPAPANVHAYNNTFYSGSSGSFSPIAFATGAGMIAKNNLGYAPASTSRDMISGSATMSNNSSDTDVLLTPGFVTGAPVAPADFRLGAASYAANAGTAVPVFSDLLRLDRPQDGAMDLGAVERP